MYIRQESGSVFMFRLVYNVLYICVLCCHVMKKCLRVAYGDGSSGQDIAQATQTSPLTSEKAQG